MIKPGRPDWPAEGETRILQVGSAEWARSMQDVSKQIECVQYFKELLGAFGIKADRFTNNHLFALAANIGITREEFDRYDDWDLVSKFRIAVATGALKLPNGTSSTTRVARPIEVLASSGTLAFKVDAPGAVALLTAGAVRAETSANRKRVKYLVLNIGVREARKIAGVSRGTRIVAGTIVAGTITEPQPEVIRPRVEAAIESQWDRLAEKALEPEPGVVSYVEWEEACVSVNWLIGLKSEDPQYPRFSASRLGWRRQVWEWIVQNATDDYYKDFKNLSSLHPPELLAIVEACIQRNAGIPHAAGLYSLTAARSDAGIKRILGQARSRQDGVKVGGGGRRIIPREIDAEEFMQACGRMNQEQVKNNSGLSVKVQGKILRCETVAKKSNTLARKFIKAMEQKRAKNPRKP